MGIYSHHKFAVVNLGGLWSIDRSKGVNCHCSFSAEHGNREILLVHADNPNGRTLIAVTWDNNSQDFWIGFGYPSVSAPVLLAHVNVIPCPINNCLMKWKAAGVGFKCPSIGIILCFVIAYYDWDLRYIFHPFTTIVIQIRRGRQYLPATTRWSSVWPCLANCTTLPDGCLVKELHFLSSPPFNHHKPPSIACRSFSQRQHWDIEWVIGLIRTTCRRIAKRVSELNYKVSR